jgi:hypothetical protein
MQAVALDGLRDLGGNDVFNLLQVGDGAGDLIWLAKAQTFRF